MRFDPSMSEGSIEELNQAGRVTIRAQKLRNGAPVDVGEPMEMEIN